jgi:uncharacterized protein
MEQRLSVVTLGVADLARSRKFYEEGLGWKELQGAKEIAFYQLPGFALALYPYAALAEDARLPAIRSGFGGITLAINVASPEATDSILREAERAGAKILKPAQKVFWGGYSGYFADLDGYPWEVAHNPFCTLHPDGRTTLNAAT